MEEKKATEVLNESALKAEYTNCCNGRVANLAELAEIAKLSSEVMKMVQPRGVELLASGVSEEAMRKKEPTNCCNGRVGKLQEDIMV